MNELTKREPFNELADLQNRLTSLFRHERELSGPDDTFLTRADWAPAVDVSEDDKEYLVTADLPDVKKSQVKVTVDGGMLTITGERKHEKKEKKKKFHRIERSYGKYQRSFRVPDDVQANKLKADFKKGVLKVHLPKGKGKKSKAREVKVA